MLIYRCMQLKIAAISQLNVLGMIGGSCCACSPGKSSNEVKKL